MLGGGPPLGCHAATAVLFSLQCNRAGAEAEARNIAEMRLDGQRRPRIPPMPPRRAAERERGRLSAISAEADDATGGGPTQVFSVGTRQRTQSLPG